MGYIVGLLCGDGYLYHDKKQRHYNIEFYLHSERDKDIQNYLIHLLGKMGSILYYLRIKDLDVPEYAAGQRIFTLYFEN